MVPTEKGLLALNAHEYPLKWSSIHLKAEWGFGLVWSFDAGATARGKEARHVTQGDLECVYLDLGRLGKALNGLSALQPTMKSAADQVAKILSGWSHLLVDQRLDKDYHVQTMQIVLP